MATYYHCLNNQTEVLSSPYLRDQMYLPQASSTPPYTELLSTDSLQSLSVGPKSEVEFISQGGGSPNFDSYNGEQHLSSQSLLSLSLGTQIPSPVDVPTYQYQYAGPDSSHILSPHVQLEYDFEGYKAQAPVGTTYNYRYMKAAQELLDEVVNVQKALKQSETDKQKKSDKLELFGSKEMEIKMNGSSPDACISSSKSISECSPLERQQLKDKLGNLCSMVDEVDRRYRRYCHQIQVVVSSFEKVAGHGAARSYTALALCTISRQFRCLRDAINDQILAVRQSLGEKDAMPSVEGKLTRLRYVDQQMRHQRAALQQFGVMRHSWRPQRGLPGSSISILRAWLFEHFLHPYPKDSEKIMLARQTGLTRGQVANWFINARVRLWKPMIEEMYKEEFGETDSSSSPDPSPRTATANNKPWTLSEDMGEKFKESVTITKAADDSKSSLIPSVGLKGCTARLGFQNGPCEQTNVDCKTLPDSSGFPATCDLPELVTFSVAKQVSLSLGLQQGEKDSLLITSSEMRFGENHEGDYHRTDPSSPSQINDPNLLPDFVP